MSSNTHVSVFQRDFVSWHMRMFMKWYKNIKVIDTEIKLVQEHEARWTSSFSEEALQGNVLWSFFQYKYIIIPRLEPISF